MIEGTVRDGVQLCRLRLAVGVPWPQRLRGRDVMAREEASQGHRSCRKYWLGWSRGMRSSAILLPCAS
jgi:hypothetical protein